MTQYILKNKDKIVLEFEVETIEEQSIGIIDFQSYRQNINSVRINDVSLLPFGFKKDDLKDELQSWIQNRKAPKNRAFIEKITATYGGNDRNFMLYIDVSFGLSLNDSYWIIPADKNYKWKDFNLYDNEFSEALALCAFGLKMTKINGFTSSPEFTTNGMLKKCWHRDNGQIYLYKGQSQQYANGGREAFAEYFSSQLANFLGFNAITYNLKLFHNEIVSSCPIFTNENEGYVPIYYYLNKEKYSNKNIQSEREIMRIYGKEAFEDLMVFDALIANQDRHLGNFGMIINNNTNEILCPAPIFDNSASLFNTLCKDEFDDINTAIAEHKSYFGYSFDEQLKRFLQERHIEKFEKLQNFHFKKHPQFAFNEQWLEKIENYLHLKAKECLSLQNSAKSQKHNTVISKKRRL